MKFFAFRCVMESRIISEDGKANIGDKTEMNYKRGKWESQILRQRVCGVLPE